ncbi:MAG: dephospho-CoA kinase, partial [Rhodoglobus sp.]
PGLAAIRDTFGAEVIDDDGRLDRAALGKIIFSDREKRAELNAITHPAVWARAKVLFDEANAKDPHAVVVYDVPLLVESSANRPMKFDLIVVVHAALAERIRRLVELRGMTREEATHRLNSQASDTERLAIADVVIDSNGTLDETLRQVDELWAMAAASAVSAQ